MTNTEKLIAAGWTRQRATDECGEAITTRRDLIGLACGKGATWVKDGEPARCAQHALLVVAATPAPGETIEYGLAEVVAGEQRPLPQCGSWYTDRYYTDDLTGVDAALAASRRVADQAGGTYVVVELRRFARVAA